MDPVSNACDELFEDIAGSDKQVRLLVALETFMVVG